jgi:hypothetical protein
MSAHYLAQHVPKLDRKKRGRSLTAFRSSGCMTCSWEPKRQEHLFCLRSVLSASCLIGLCGRGSDVTESFHFACLSVQVTCAVFMLFRISRRLDRIEKVLREGK